MACEGVDLKGSHIQSRQVQPKPVENGKDALRKNDNRDREPVRSTSNVYLATFSNRHMSTSLQRQIA